MPPAPGDDDPAQQIADRLIAQAIPGLINLLDDDTSEPSPYDRTPHCLRCARPLPDDGETERYLAPLSTTWDADALRLTFVPAHPGEACYCGACALQVLRWYVETGRAERYEVAGRCVGYVITGPDWRE